MDNKEDIITIDLSNTCGDSTSYITSDSMIYTISVDDTIDYNNLGNITITGSAEPQWWVTTHNTHIEISKIENMCKEYPALAKVYENFKTVYDLVKQDWESKNDDTKTS
jgi:hypothetical protein